MPGLTFFPGEHLNIEESSQEIFERGRSISVGAVETFEIW